MQECIERSEPFGMVRAMADGKIDKVGCRAQLLHVLKKYPDGRMDILNIGTERFLIKQLFDQRNFYQAEVEEFLDVDEPAVDFQLAESALTLHHELVLMTGIEQGPIDPNAGPIAFQLASTLPVDNAFKQQLLEMQSESGRLLTLLDYYTKIISRLKTMSFGAEKHELVN